MKILILTQKPNEQMSEACDITEEMNFVTASLMDMGHDVVTSNIVTLDFSQTADEVRSINPDVIFNLIEEVSGNNSMAAAAAALLEYINIPFTGSSSATISATTDKQFVKPILQAARIPTPMWMSARDILGEDTWIDPGRRYIIKPVREDASVGIEYSSVVLGSDLKCKFEAFGIDAYKYFAEAFVPGREILIPLIYDGWRQCMRAYPGTEILYVNTPDMVPNICTYDAKWRGEKAQYPHDYNTDFSSHQDKELIKTCNMYAEKVCRLFDIRGYARIDFRVSEGIPYVIDINANADIGKDSYVVDGAERGGLTHSDLMSCILENCNGI